jgi:hypothetical protein
MVHPGPLYFIFSIIIIEMINPRTGINKVRCSSMLHKKITKTSMSTSTLAIIILYVWHLVITWWKRKSPSCIQKWMTLYVEISRKIHYSSMKGHQWKKELKAMLSTIRFLFKNVHHQPWVKIIFMYNCEKLD